MTVNPDGGEGRSAARRETWRQTPDGCTVPAGYYGPVPYRRAKAVIRCPQGVRRLNSRLTETARVNILPA